MRRSRSRPPQPTARASPRRIREFLRGRVVLFSRPSPCDYTSVSAIANGIDDAQSRVHAPRSRNQHTLHAGAQPAPNRGRLPPLRPPPVSARRMRSSSASGTEVLALVGDESACRAFRAEQAAHHRQPGGLDALRKTLECGHSKTGLVTTNSAPASTLYSNRLNSSSRFGAVGLTETPM